MRARADSDGKDAGLPQSGFPLSHVKGHLTNKSAFFSAGFVFFFAPLALGIEKADKLFGCLST
jgi:hypothetical protein